MALAAGEPSGSSTRPVIVNFPSAGSADEAEAAGFGLLEASWRSRSDEFFAASAEFGPASLLEAIAGRRAAATPTSGTTSAAIRTVAAQVNRLERGRLKSRMALMRSSTFDWRAI